MKKLFTIVLLIAFALLANMSLGQRRHARLVGGRGRALRRRDHPRRIREHAALELRG